MLKFIIDEDLPRSTTTILIENEYDAIDIRDYNLRGKSDQEIFQFAQHNKAVLITGDIGFGNILHFPIKSHHGIVILCFPNKMSNMEINRQLIKRLKELPKEDLHGNLIIIKPGQIKIRRKSY